jgi:hypothetical protein
MELDIHKLDAVWTSDEKRLGLAQHLFHREHDINPDLQLYASYLEVGNYDYGEVYYVPTDFIAGQESHTGNIKLSVSFDHALKRTWFRMPEFVARGEARQQQLPELGRA